MSPELSPTALEFTATLIEWRGPAPFVFAPIPTELTGEIAFGARDVSYGWGVVPVSAVIGRSRFTTSLFPRGGAYLLPIKVSVQRAERIGPGSTVTARITIGRDPG